MYPSEKESGIISCPLMYMFKPRMRICLMTHTAQLYDRFLTKINSYLCTRIIPCHPCSLYLMIEVLSHGSLLMADGIFPYIFLSDNARNSPIRVDYFKWKKLTYLILTG